MIGLPVISCLIFWALPLGSIGFMIPLTGIANAVVLPFLLYKAILKAFKVNKYKLGIGLASTIGGVILSVLGMNIFIAMTVLFGIKDYQLM